MGSPYILHRANAFALQVDSEARIWFTGGMDTNTNPAPVPTAPLAHGAFVVWVLDGVSASVSHYADEATARAAVEYDAACYAEAEDTETDLAWYTNTHGAQVGSYADGLCEATIVTVLS